MTRLVQPSIEGGARISMDLSGAAAAADDPAEAAGEVDDLGCLAILEHPRGMNGSIGYSRASPVLRFAQETP